MAGTSGDRRSIRPWGNLLPSAGNAVGSGLAGDARLSVALHRHGRAVAEGNPSPALSAVEPPIPWDQASTAPNHEQEPYTVPGKMWYNTDATWTDLSVRYRSRLHTWPLAACVQIHVVTRAYGMGLSSALLAVPQHGTAKRQIASIGTMTRQTDRVVRIEFPPSFCRSSVIPSSFTRPALVRTAQERASRIVFQGASPRLFPSS